MTKAKTIDRLELTRKKFKQKPDERTVIYPAPDCDNYDALKECPMCKSKSLRLDGGCMSCLSCGWSACG